MIYGSSAHSHDFAPDYRYVYGNINISSHTHTITPSWDTMKMLPDTPKEKPMSTLEKIKQQRKEERERGRIERMYTEYDESGLSGVDDGTVITFTWSPDDGPDSLRKEYRYAAITNDGGRFWVTGRYGPNGASYEDFVAWLIEKDIAADDLTWWETA